MNFTFLQALRSRFTFTHDGSPVILAPQKPLFQAAPVVDEHAMVVVHPDVTEIKHTHSSRHLKTTEYAVGQELTGEVTGFAEFGVFVTLQNGESGLVPNEHICFKGQDVCLRYNDEVTVRVMSFKPHRGLLLSVKQAMQRVAYADFLEDFAVGDEVNGTIKSVVDYGIFVTLAPGVEGLLHKSKIDDISVLENAKVGQKMNVGLAEISTSQRRVALVLAG